MNVDGSRLRVVTDNISLHVEIAWSPDGQTLLFTGEDGLYTVNLDGANRRLLVDLQTRQVGWITYPSYSPDGKSIIFNWRNELGPLQICTVNVDGTKFQCLFNTFEYLSPVWSPDGKNIVYSSNGQLYRMDKNAENATAIGETGTLPTWSPDGKKLAFSRGLSLFAMDMQTHQTREITTRFPVVGRSSWLP